MDIFSELGVTENRSQTHQPPMVSMDPWALDLGGLETSFNGEAKPLVEIYRHQRRSMGTMRFRNVLKQWI